MYRPRRIGTGMMMAALAVMVTTGCGDVAGSETTDASVDATSTAPSSTAPSATVPSSTAPSTTAPEASTTTPPATTESTTVDDVDGVVAYFLVDDVGETTTAGPHLVPVHVPSAGDGPQAALEALLAGPTADQRAGTPALATAVPDGTRMLGLDVDDGIATVDLSGEFDDGGGSAAMFGRLSQLVYTVTRDDGIDQVVLSIEGEPVEVFSGEGIILDGPQARQDHTAQLPAIFVDSPAWGAEVTSPVTVTGVADVFEATFQAVLTDDDGLPLDESSVTTTCGSGCWGEFELEVEWTVDRAQVGALIVWQASPEDGRRIDVREYPVRLR